MRGVSAHFFDFLVELNLLELRTGTAQLKGRLHSRRPLSVVQIAHRTLIVSARLRPGTKSVHVSIKGVLSLIEISRVAGILEI